MPFNEDDWSPASKYTDDTVAKEAAKTATNFMEFQEEVGLIIGDMTDDELSKNVLIDADSVDIRDGENTLSSFQAYEHEYASGMGTVSAVTSSIALGDEDITRVVAERGVVTSSPNDEGVAINKVTIETRKGEFTGSDSMAYVRAEMLENPDGTPYNSTVSAGAKNFIGRFDNFNIVNTSNDAILKLNGESMPRHIRVGRCPAFALPANTWNGPFVTFEEPMPSNKYDLVLTQDGDYEWSNLVFIGGDRRTNGFYVSCYSGAAISVRFSYIAILY